MFTVYLLDPKNITSPITIGNVSGEDEVTVSQRAVELISSKYSPQQIDGWGFEAIEFFGRKRHMAGILKNHKTHP